MLLQIFDVEHGACALLTCDNGNRVMIDCGHNATTGWKPGDHLKRFTNKLDVLMITNYDEDHVSGLVELEKEIYVDWMIRNPSVTGATLIHLKSDTGAGKNIQHLASRFGSFGPSADPLPALPGVSWQTFWNVYPAFKDENNLSVAVALTVNGVNFLFPGDLEAGGWLNLLRSQESFRTAVANTHVLMASHHGRENGICKELFDVYKCRPQIVVLSDDYHQYDTQKTTAYYQSKTTGIKHYGENRYVLTTRCDGEIWFDFSGQPYGNALCTKPLY